MEKMEKKVIVSIFLAAFLCLSVSVSAVYAQGNEYESGVRIIDIDLNDQGGHLTIEPGGAIELKIWYEFWYPYPLSNDLPEVVIGFDDMPMDCLIAGLLDDITGLTGVFDFSRTYKLAAPTEPSIYNIMVAFTRGCTCTEAQNLYLDNPSTRKIIGTIEVIADEEESGEWKPIYYKDYTIKFSNSDKYGRYSIMFYQHRQHHNELRMEIDTWERHQIWEGSVSMSVEEDVWINYYTGKAWGIHLGETDFREIDPNPSNAVGESFFKLIMGFIPYAGLAMNLVDCGEALSEPKDEFDVYDEVDRTGHFKNPSKVFTTTNYLNDRDVVIIAYPCGPILAGKSVVRVDFPRLEFQKQGTNDVVFCIDGQILGNVRHYIALPIEIGKQRMEA
jgi:hypothetical protein